ncbi:MAG: helix-hairpin-helix domain-containing protein [candidate division WOR-3 bacterium]
MKPKKEFIVLLVLLVVLAGINLLAYIQYTNQQKGIELIVKEGTKPISINNAEVDDLEALPGIGPALARRIVEYRARHGAFKDLDELKDVKGIGEKVFRQILPFIEL